MKKFFVIVATATLILSGCGASRKTQLALYQQQLELQKLQQQQRTADEPGRTEVKLNECEELSMDFSDGSLKAYASAVNVDKDFARTTAVTRARAELAASLKSLVTNVIKTYRRSDTVGTIQDYEDKAEQTADVIAEEQMAYTAVACSKLYVVSNGKYEAAVCVKMINDFQEVCRDAVKRALSEDDKLRTEFDEVRFRKSAEESLSRYRQMKGY